MPTKSTHIIEVTTCDHTSSFDMELTTSEAELIKVLAAMSEDASTCYCGPKIYVTKCA